MILTIVNCGCPRDKSIVTTLAEAAEGVSDYRAIAIINLIKADYAFRQEFNDGCIKADPNVVEMLRHKFPEVFCTH